MFKFRFIYLILLLISSLGLAAQPQSKTQKGGTSTVSGRVTLKGEPARGVTVILHSENTASSEDPDSTPRGRTDENGRFRITKVTAGAYYVRAIAPGLIAAGWKSFEPEGKALKLADGEDVENIDLELARGGVITGRIIDSNGRPLVEERVELLKLDKNGKPEPFYFENLLEINSTDDRGAYRIFGLPEGRYLVRVGILPGEDRPVNELSGAYYPRTFHPDVSSESDAKIIEISEGSEAPGVDITVAKAMKTYDVYGRVINAESKQPVANALVSYSPITSDSNIIWPRSSGGRSDEKGEFRLRNVLPGKFSVIAKGDKDSEFYSDPVIFEITNSDARDLEINMRQGGSISGVVVIEGTNEPAILKKLSRIRVIVRIWPDQAGEQGGVVNINPDGSFRAKGLRPGKNRFMMIHEPELEGFKISRVERDGVPQRRGVDVGPGEHISNVRLVYDYGSLTIRGEVTIVGGVLPKNVGIFVRTNRPNVPDASSEIDARGQFLLENLSPGEYDVILTHYSSTEEPVDERVIKAISQVKQKVIVSADNQPRISLELDLSRKDGSQ